MGRGPPGRARRRPRGKRILSGACDRGSGRLQECGSSPPEEPRLRRLLPLRPGPGGSQLESALAAARLRASRERSGRREGASPGREPRVQPQAPAGCLRRAARFLRSHQHPRADRGRSELTRRRPRGAGGDGEPADKRARHSPRARPRAAAGGAGHVRVGGGDREGARRAGDSCGEYRHHAADADPAHGFFGAAPTRRAPGLGREDHRSRARAEAGPYRSGGRAARVRGRGPPGARRVLADAVDGRRRRRDPGQRAGHRGWTVHRVVWRDPAQLRHRVGARVGTLRRRRASASGRAGRGGAPDRRGRDHRDA